MANDILAITEARLVLPQGIVTGSCLIKDGRILAAGRLALPQAARTISARGHYVGPGFVDIHCHASKSGQGYTKPTVVARDHLEHGTTSLLITLGYSLPQASWLAGINNIRQAMAENTNLAGIHFEGPYINPAYGAKSQLAWQIKRSEYEEIFARAAGLVKQCTYAPEMPSAREFARFVSSQGVTLAAGHTQMSPAELDQAIADGCTLITHLYDAMGCHLGNTSVKQTGIIQETAVDAALARTELMYELICDSLGVHVKPSNLQVALRAVGPSQLILVTDSTYQPYDPKDFSPPDPRSTPDLNYNDLGQLSGSRLTMDQACRNMKKHTGAKIEDIFQMASLNPARVVGLASKYGSIEAGKKANLVICTADFQLKAVYLAGQSVLGQTIEGRKI